MKKTKDKKKISRKDFFKNILASWYLFLVPLGLGMFFGFLTVLLVVGVVKERIEIAQKAPAYEVVEGEILSVDVKKYYGHGSRSTISKIIPEKKYVAVISYVDEMGLNQQLRSSEVDKKLKVGKQVKIVYNPEDKEDADLAYFDILEFTYVPCYLSSFKWFYMVYIILFFLLAIIFGQLFWEMIEECAQKEYQKTPKKKLTRAQLRVRRNICIVMQCIFLPICIFWHYSYLNGDEFSLFLKLDEMMVNWPFVWKQITIILVCYSPVLIFYGLHKRYEHRRLKTE